MTYTQANEPGFVLDAEALEAAAKASYEYEGDRREIDYLGWSGEPENVRLQWLQSVRLPVETYCAAAAPIVPAPAYGVKEALEPFAKAARAFEIAIGPDGLDDGLTVEARISARPEHEAILCTADFSRARAAYDALSSAPAEEADAKAVYHWHPISIAPRNGTVVWLFEPHAMGGFMFAGAVNADGVWINNLDLKVQNPTHWMPLPAPPQDNREG